MKVLLLLGWIAWMGAMVDGLPTWRALDGSYETRAACTEMLAAMTKAIPETLAGMRAICLPKGTDPNGATL